MFKNQPAGLYFLSLANTGERFGYYTMISIFLLYLQAKFGMNAGMSGQFYAIFLALVYFIPLFGGWIADRWNFSKCVVTGMAVMFLGYLVMAIPTPVRSDFSLGILIVSLLLICIGTGLFKGNIQVMIGDLYNNRRYSGQRDAAFSIFYMAINIGSMLAPMAATHMCNISLRAHGFPYVGQLPGLCNNYLDGHENQAELIQVMADNGLYTDNLNQFATDYISALSTGYGYAFGLACISIIISFIIYYIGRKTYSHNQPEQKVRITGETGDSSLTKEQVRQRVTALLLVFAVVIFFWMVYNQNGATLTEFAKSYTSQSCSGPLRLGFNAWILSASAIIIYAVFHYFQTSLKSAKIISGTIIIACIAAICLLANNVSDPLTNIQPQEYQQFNPFYVIVLTPVSIAFFSWLSKRGKEPSAPRKIGYGMIVAAVAYAILCAGSTGNIAENPVSPSLLMETYLFLTIAELLLSPMGISFVTKVAPPKMRGSMMGGWFAATAIGNYLVSLPMLLWGEIPVYYIWGILAIICMISAGFIFSIMKRLEITTEE